MYDRPKRKRGPSNRQKPAWGMPTSSSDELEAASQSGSASEQDSDTSTTATASATRSTASPPTPASSTTSPLPSSTQPSSILALRRSDSNLSAVSAFSATMDGLDGSSKPKEKTKSRTFDERFKTATRSNSEVLKAQMATWTSDVYKHYQMPPSIEIKKDVVTYVYRCNKPSTFVTRARHDESTSNLKCHVNKCSESINSPEARALTAYAFGSQYHPAKHRLEVSLWIAHRARPFSIIEDKELLDIFHDLNAACESPSCHTVSRDICEIWDFARKELSIFLQSLPGKIHLVVDGWTSPNVISFIGAVAQYVANGEVKSIVLDYVKCTSAHTGIYLAARVSESVHKFGIQNKIMGFTADNAGNNNTLVTELANLIPSFKGEHYRVRCFAHILNLIVKAILSPFSHKLKEAIPGEDDEFLPVDMANFEKELSDLTSELNSFKGVGDEEPNVDEDTDNVAPDVLASDAAAVQEAISDANLDLRVAPLTSAQVKLGRTSIAKLRALGVKVVNSPTISSDLETCCIELKVKPNQMIRDVSTRWNSTAELIQRAVELSAPLSNLVVMADHNKPRGVRLSRFKLEPPEWDLLRNLGPLLDVFLYATKLVSTNKIPLVHQVIPLIDRITTALEDKITSLTLPAIIRHAALRGFHMLNKYYSHTDDSVVYRVTMVLHPGYKLEYFARAGWKPEWIAAARELTRTAWQEYKPNELAVQSSAAPEC